MLILSPYGLTLIPLWKSNYIHDKCWMKLLVCEWLRVQITYQLSTFSFQMFFLCLIFLVVFSVIAQSELISVWFREKMTFSYLNFINHHIFEIYVGGASSGLSAVYRLIAVRGAHLPSVDGLDVKYIKCTTMLNLPSQYIWNYLKYVYGRYTRIYKYTGALLLYMRLHLAPSSRDLCKFV